MARLSAHMRRKAHKLTCTEGSKVAGRYWSDADEQWKFVGFPDVDAMAEWQSIMNIKLEGVRHG